MHYKVICDTSDREAWLKERAALRAVPASDCYLLFPEFYRINHWTGQPFSTIDSLKNRLAGAYEEKRGESKSAYLGGLFEAPMLEAVRTLCDMDIRPIQKLLMSAHYPISATPDAYGSQLPTRKSKHWVTAPPPTGAKMVIECKWLAHERLQERFTDDTIPPEYMCQLQAQMLVMGAPLGSLCAMFGGQDIMMWLVEQDKELQGEIVQRAKNLLASII